MALVSEIRVTVNGRTTQFDNQYEAKDFEMQSLAEEPEGTVVEVCTEFPDGDSWRIWSVRKGDILYCEPDPTTSNGLDAIASIKNELGIEFVGKGFVLKWPDNDDQRPAANGKVS